jgi:hypothetical protein
VQSIGAERKRKINVFYLEANMLTGYHQADELLLKRLDVPDYYTTGWDIPMFI